MVVVAVVAVAVAVDSGVVVAAVVVNCSKQLPARDLIGQNGQFRLLFSTDNWP